MTRQFYLEMLRFHSWYSELKCGTPGFKKNFSFSENLCIENQILKTFKITNDCHVKTCRSLNPIQDGLLWGCSQMGGGKKAPLPKIGHISYSDGTWHSYTSPKDDPKNKWITWYTPWFLLTLALFQRYAAKYQEIRIEITFWCIIFNSFDFSWVFKDCFNKHGYNFDDVSKSGFLSKGYDVKQR